MSRTYPSLVLRGSKLARSGYFSPLFAAILGSFTFAYWFPGQLPRDSASQYAESLSGHITDWHSPIMGRLWALLEPLAGGPWSLFALNTTLYWLGLAAIAEALRRSGRATLAVLTLLGGASPLFMFFNRQIITDVGLASAFIAAFGVTFWFRYQGRSLPAAAWIFITSALVYGTLVRTNGAFAVPPLIFYACGLRPRIASPKWLCLCVGMSIALIPLTIAANRSVLGAANSGAVQRLQIYDIVGIAYRTGDYNEIRAAAGGVPTQLSHCYSPVLWDTLMHLQCDNLWYRLPPPGTPARAEIGRLWIRAIIDHPIAYALHRFEHFNIETFFMVPPAPQCVSAPELHDCGPAQTEAQRTLKSVPLTYADYLLKNPVVWPITWLALAIALAVFSRDDESELATAAGALLASALIYGAAYAAIGIAMNVRYFYWTILSTQTAAIMLLFHPFESKNLRTFLYVLGPVVVIVVIGYVFRFGAIDLFVR